MENEKPASVTLKGYTSHAIRGRKGNECSVEEMEYNCDKAYKAMTFLHGLLTKAGIPVSLYIPAANDEFVQTAYRAGRISEKDILDTDCDIISTCDFVLVYNWNDYLGGGVGTEIEYAKEHNIPVIIITHLDPSNYAEVLKTVSSIWAEKLSQPTIIKLPG